MTGYQFGILYLVYIVSLFLVYRYIKKRIRRRQERQRLAAQARQCVDFISSDKGDKNV